MVNGSGGGSNYFLQFDDWTVLQTDVLFGSKTEETLSSHIGEVFFVNVHLFGYLVNLGATSFISREEWGFHVLLFDFLIISDF